MRKITLGTLSISDRGKQYVNEALDNNRLSYGKLTQKFEQEFAKLHDCKHGIFLNSGTSALQVSLAALKEIHEYKDGDEVIVPACTFIATSNIVLMNNMKPVFVDVRPDTFNIDPSRIHDALSSRTRCILPVHLFGLPADMMRIMQIAKKYNLQVIEDSCETVGAECYGKTVGSFGDAACFSQYIAHHITGGVGGTIITNSDQLAEISRSLMAHGRDSIYLSIDDDSDTGSGFQNIVERRYKFDRLGFSYRCTELEAALALSELELWQANVSIRQVNAKYLTRLLSDLPDKLQTPFVPEDFTHSFMMFPIVVADEADRDRLLMHLEERGIETRYLMPLLSQPIYRALFPGLEHKFPQAKRLAKQGLFIGMHQGLNQSDIGYISDVFHAYFKVIK